MTFWKKIWGSFKIFIVFIIFIALICRAFIKNNGMKLLDNWETNKSNPLIMPFAGMLGKNTESNTTGVFYTMYKTNFGFLMKPIQYTIAIIRTILGNLINNMNLFRTMMKPVRNFFQSAAQSFYDKINNFSNLIVFFLAKIRDSLGRMSSTYRLTLYSLQAIQLTIKSIWDGPIGKVSREWAHSYDVLRKFFCLAGDTEIKLINDQIKFIEDLVKIS